MRQQRRVETDYKVHISCTPAARSKSAMLHRFIAKLDIPAYDKSNVSILENPLTAKIIFRKLGGSESGQKTYMTKRIRKTQTGFVEFALHLKIYDLDVMGYNFILSYSFDDLGHSSRDYSKLTEDMPKLISASFDQQSGITVTPYSPPVDEFRASL